MCEDLIRVASICVETITCQLTTGITGDILFRMSARTDTEASSNQASSGVTPDTLGATLREKLEASHVDIQDLSGKSPSS